jgi:hypothetical protein
LILCWWIFTVKIIIFKSYVDKKGTVSSIFNFKI